MQIISEDTQQNLIRHLLRTVCTDITNLVLNAVATDHMMSIDDESQFNTEVKCCHISEVILRHSEFKTKCQKKIC